MDIDLRSVLNSEMVLAGGNTLFPGFPERLLLELQKARGSAKFRVLAKQARDILCWQGGMLYAGLSSTKNQWITRK
jgi:centractin